MKRTPVVLILLLSFPCLAFPLAAQSTDAQVFDALSYRNVGPSRGGRVTAVAGVADEPGTFYMGATGGGVWKTTDYGQSWNNISDGFFATASIGAIRVAASDSDIVYVGTGSDGIRSNVITGRGVYKSTDAGKTWAFVGLRDSGQIGAVEIHPSDPDTVFVAALGQAFGPNSERGVFRSRDGGASWEKVLFVSDRTGAVDLEFSPDNPREIYASMWRAERKPWTIISGGEEGGVYKSGDSGDTWVQLGGGLPSGIRGKSDLAVTPAAPDRLYVLMEAPKGEGGLYRSDDRGETFTLISTESRILDRPFYYTNVDADPADPDLVYVNSTRFLVSRDAGKSWRTRRTPHGDNHDMWINPKDSKLFIQSNDGGANVTRDGGRTWSTQHNQPTAELYQVNVDDRFPYWLYAGQQDNSTIRVPSLPPHPTPAGAAQFWESVGGCETGPAVPQPGDAAVVFSNCKGRFGRYNHRTGQEQQFYVGAANMYGHNPRDLKYRFQRVSPILVSPHDRNIVYHASQYLHRTLDGGRTWETISPDLTANDSVGHVFSGTPITRDITGEEFYSTIYSVQESPLARGVIWVGANDGPVHLTRDGGRTWRDVTPSGLPRRARIQTVEASPHKAEKAYIAAYRYLLGDWEPYIFRTDDFGRSWTRLTTGANGIPADTPTRVIREDPDREGLLYAGTEFGLYVSFDDGQRWHSMQLNLPVTPVTDIKVHRQDLVLSTMGRSFWILDNLTPLHQYQTDLLADAHHFFQPRAAHRLRYRSPGRSPGGADYPPAGAVIDYFLAEQPAGGVQLEIADSAGKPVRVLQGIPAEGEEEEDEEEETSFRRGPVLRPLQYSAGLHRWMWDMRHEPPATAMGSEREGRGPMVAPGRYSLTLRAGDWSATQTLEVLIDPRVGADGVSQRDLEEQEKLSLQVRDLLSRARGLCGRIQESRTELRDAAQGSSGNSQALRRLDELHDLLVTTEEHRYPTPMLLDQIEYLYAMLDRADQRPGGDAYERFEELKAALERHQRSFEEISRSYVLSR